MIEGDEAMRLVLAVEHRCRAREYRRRAIDCAREGEILASWTVLQRAAYQESWAQAMISGDPARKP
jgi:hypothetical protein